MCVCIRSVHVYSNSVLKMLTVCVCVHSVYLKNKHEYSNVRMQSDSHWLCKFTMHVYLNGILKTSIYIQTGVLNKCRFTSMNI